MLVNTKEILIHAKENKYAVPAFNVENMEMMQAVIEAATELRSPVILQTTPSTLRYASPEFFCGMATFASKKADVPIAMHLDHGDSYELAVKCLAAGYSSAMYDGSKHEFDENAAVTKKVVDLAKFFDVHVEGELGRVGGKEDDLVVEHAKYTDPDEAVEFVKVTGVSSLAVAIGTVHGVYKEEPNLNFEILEEIQKKVSVPLVLHGTSGVDDEDVKKAISLGICKVNYATDLRQAFTKEVSKYMLEEKNPLDPKKYLALGRQSVKEYCKNKILVCGSNNRY
ncbi:class II fructose-1,6-bisphosphate aldolase [Oceanivirga miroungae]|uniref:Fructose-1,6-bisphosphate aldolase n=1 Tax=Oceanivirga miroungae TaxID=1130046 RepID=A0A6I8MDS3_9FUSO|nr:class II fructose-1,6-bisphosphate aldolase [Oceanivirga miroungae]VWL85666.1 fructose-1,6-bisphosphate aldolase [Oceanivirga miroungae]